MAVTYRCTTFVVTSNKTRSNMDTAQAKNSNLDKYLILPDVPKQSILNEPGMLLMYAHGKVGKTTIIGDLTCYLDAEGKSLGVIVDLEHGGEYVDGTVIEFNKELPIHERYEHLVKMFTTLEAYKKKFGKNRYEYGCVDSLSVLTTLAEYAATIRYMGTTQGKQWNRVMDKNGTPIPLKDTKGVTVMGGTAGNRKVVYRRATKPTQKAYQNIITMAEGYGYGWVRDEFIDLVYRFGRCFDKLILIAHTKTKISEASNNQDEAKGSEVDLQGKLRDAIPRLVDATCKLTVNYEVRTASFKTSDSSTGMGGRVARLEGKDIELSKKLPDGSIQVNWQEIYPSLANADKMTFPPKV